MAVGACSTALLLGAYYYTWYGVGEQWQVFPRTFEPTMGEYHSASDDVMQIHHAQGREACLDFFAVSWGGDGSRAAGKHAANEPPEPVAGKCVVHNSDGTHMSPFCTDNEGNSAQPERGKIYKVQGWKDSMRWWTPSADVDALIQRHLEVPNGLPMALMYELRDVLGVGEGQGRVDLSLGNEAVIEHHLLYAAEHYFRHPRYFRIEGRPVLFLYTMRDYDNFEEPLIRVLAKVKARIGTDLHLVGDMVWWGPAPEHFPWASYNRVGVATVTAYNMYEDDLRPFMGRRFPAEVSRHFLRVAQHANAHNITVTPYVSPGYDDRKMRGGSRPAVPRAQGAMYMRAWQSVQWLLQCQFGASKPRLMMVNSFNEWHEGTQIEPSVEFGRSFLDYTRAFKNRATATFLTGDAEVAEACESPAENFQRWFNWGGNWSDALAVGHHHWDASVRETALDVEDALNAARLARDRQRRDASDRLQQQPQPPWRVPYGAHAAVTLAVLVLVARARGHVGVMELVGAVLVGWFLINVLEAVAAEKAKEESQLGAVLKRTRAGRARARANKTHALADELHSWNSTALGPVAAEAVAILDEEERGLRESFLVSLPLPFKCQRWARQYAMSPWPVEPKDFEHNCTG